MGRGGKNRTKRGSVHQDTQKVITKFHEIRKSLAREEDPAKRQLLLEKEAALGGLKGYQDSSVYAGSKERGGETSKYLMKEVLNLQGSKKIRMLDVGAVAGTAYQRWPFVTCTSIDLNSRAAHVQQADVSQTPHRSRACRVTYIYSSL